MNYEDVADLSNVTFTFKSKSTGTGSFNVSDAVLSSSTVSMGNSKVNVSVSAKTTTTTTKPKTNTVQPVQNETPQEPIVVAKPELQKVKRELTEMVQADYTEESWKALQELIAKAEGVQTIAEYDEIKSGLTTDSLVVAEFEKTELFNVLIALIGKTQKDYTEESWNKLQNAIDEAQSAKLKSEYDAIKAELTTDGLVKKTGFADFFQNFMDGLKQGDPIYLISAMSVILVFLLIIVLFIIIIRNRRIDRAEYQGAKRLK